MKRIIIDTNFLMIPWLYKVDIFSEFNRICNFSYKLYIYEQSIAELRSIIENQSKHKRAAQTALKLIKLKNIEMIKSEAGDVDSLILENLAKDTIAAADTIVATQDKELRQKLLKKGTSVIVLRQKKYLELVEMMNSS